MSIIVDQICKSFGAQKAVDGLSFEAKPGEVLGFLGPNGAGKTTSLRMISGHLMPDSGHVKYHDVDIHQHPMEARRQLGYLPEHNPLYTHMYVKEILTFYARLHQISNPGQRIGQVIEMVGIGKEQHKKVHQLSKGYKQRVGIAIAILHDPSVILLDEPISGLDPNQLSDIRQLIRSLAQSKTVIFSSHILSEVEQTCDKVLIINDGVLKTIQRIEEIKHWRQHKQTIIVEFEQAVDAASLTQINGIAECKTLSSTKFRIETLPGKDVRKEIYLWSVENKAVILESRVEEHSVAAVFQSLTKT